ncbi:hypothetical protein DPMN_173669 [Dreissena polymorpha]|uniref:Uncharacterized protein n=1 Tax=Dreissena polymorpha TaxID=45954 RepID=A0A9D4E214_DREPO|nr:hypothetical protein DPMN_173669 [Dreissena polymorpha]
MVLSCICVPNFLRLCDGHKNVSVADQGDNNTNIIPGQWRNVNPLKDWVSTLSMKSTTVEAKNQCEYLRVHFSSEAGSVSCQDDIM